MLVALCNFLSPFGADGSTLTSIQDLVSQVVGGGVADGSCRVPEMPQNRLIGRYSCRLAVTSRFRARS